MAFSATIGTLLQSGLPIERSYTLFVRNGYMSGDGDPFIEIPIARNGWKVDIVDGNPCVGTATFKIPLDSYLHLDEFDPTSAIQLFSAIKLLCTIVIPTSLGGGTESEFVYWGIIKTKQIINNTLTIYCEDALSVMKTAFFDTGDTLFQMTASILGPYADIALDHALNWDDGAELHTYEITRGIPTSWAFVDNDSTLQRRAWVPSAFILEWDIGAGYVEIPASEYSIDVVYGLVRFGNDLAVAYPGLVGIRVTSVSVYVEGTVELADAVEAILRYDSDCPYLGCGLPDSAYQHNYPAGLTGTFTFTKGSKAVTGVGCAFVAELQEGDRIALDANTYTYGIIASIAGNNALNLRYDFKGQSVDPPGTTYNGTGYRSTLRESGVSLSTLNWSRCDGTAATLYRRLQEEYGDSRGYKLWWDYEENQVRGDRVAIDESNATELYRPMSISETLNAEDFATSVVVKGIVGRAENLATVAGAVFTLDPDGDLAGAGFDYGVQTGYNAWDVLTWGDTTAAEQEDSMHDVSLTNCSGMNYTSATADVIDTLWYDYMTIDLGAVYALSQITLYGIPNKNIQNPPMGVRLYGSTDNVTFNTITPESAQYDLKANETKTFNVENSAPIRYIKIECRPYKWGIANGFNKVIAFREIAIHGSQTICIEACIQDTTAPGITALTGTITFDAGGPPWGVTGAGTNFAGELVVGDWIALVGTAPDFPERSYWSKVASIGPGEILGLESRYPGTPNASGAFGKSNFVEGAGGHFIGGTDNADDFIIDFYPDLIKKVFNVKHQTTLDDYSIVMSDAMALDRAYLVLNEMIRLYREIEWVGGFDPRIHIFDTCMTTDNYRLALDEDLFFLVQSIGFSDSDCKVSGIEYGAGTLR